MAPAGTRSLESGRPWLEIRDTYSILGYPIRGFTSHNLQYALGTLVGSGRSLVGGDSSVDLDLRLLHSPFRGFVNIRVYAVGGLLCIVSYGSEVGCRKSGVMAPTYRWCRGNANICAWGNLCGLLAAVKSSDICIVWSKERNLVPAS